MTVAVEERLLTVQEAAATLHVHENTIYRWIASGQLQALRVGTKALRIDPEALAAMVAGADVR